ncbi:pyridoxamine 5'-phosphate oxidase family protein [Leeia aquatica]|uniref:Pyridoxamine 5'-phosphate oxidase family protein n=1 Tax=Leeia aquatica TaxID=2725557 RepID=A0A847S4F8_9NEIS|nr:pyridoxamine 5'-phosphate oxidase family protein [Leeia aquatica]NLR74027.1 pyridoxamine 5'-phosphate oxidase family protein [Leeia aquatica]
MQDLHQQMRQMSQDLQLLHIATVDEHGLPQLRPVVGKADADMTIRFSTHLDSDKVAQIWDKPDVQLILGASHARSETWLRVTGRAKISTSQEEREAFWFEGLKAFVQDVNDPRYCVVIVRPKRVRMHNLFQAEPVLDWQPGA